MLHSSENRYLHKSTFSVNNYVARPKSDEKLFPWNNMLNCTIFFGTEFLKTLGNFDFVGNRKWNYWQYSSFFNSMIFREMQMLVKVQILHLVIWIILFELNRKLLPSESKPMIERVKLNRFVFIKNNFKVRNIQRSVSIEKFVGK